MNKQARVLLLVAAGLSLNSEAVFADEGVPEPKALFKHLDANSDGTLTSSEIPKEQMRFFERLVRQADDNKDGELSQDEFVKGHAKEESPSLPLNSLGGQRGGENIRQRFEMLDKNQDGKITLSEVPDRAKERLKPIFERLQAEELTLDDLRRAQGFGEAMRDQDPEKLFAQFDTNQDGKLNQDDVQREGPRRMLQQALQRAGKNSDAEITKSEFIALMANRPRMPDENRPRPEGDRRPPAPRFLREVDVDRNGRISKEELKAAHERFGELDEDGDGELDIRELLGPPPEMFRERMARRPFSPDDANKPRPGEMDRAPPFFGRMDRNGDGKITEEEVPPLLKNRFSQLDTNQDGSLSPEEMKEGAPRGRPRPKRPEAE